MHIVLAGDSILDNVAYTRGNPDVIAQVRELLPEGWQATLLALDGSTTYTVLRQAENVPPDVTHIVLSVGGNDALWRAQILQMPAVSVSQALREMTAIADEFERNYREAVMAFHKLALPLTLCTIYSGCFPDAAYQRVISAALVHFNDVILRVGFEFGLNIVDLRAICCRPEDYANAIEPSSEGGAKIARAIVNAVFLADTKNVTRVISS